MTCPSCGRGNPADARFCGGCGTPLARRCPACGASGEHDARFCTACGTALQQPGAAPERAVARKVVTVVFADLIGSVALHERVDAESGRRLMERYHRTMTAAVEVHGGRVVQLLGDGVLAAFGVPRVAEDDAIRAVRAAVGMQRAFRELLRAEGANGAALAGVGLRVAVNTGEMVVGDDETAVIGDTTNVAARLQHEARDGDVLLGEGTQRLIGDLVTLAPLGAFALRGRAESVRAYRVVSLERPASSRAVAFVGRDAELRRLLATFEAAVAAPGPRLAVLLGSPGLGKSRLVGELARLAGARATVLAARCDAAGGATFAPIAAALRAFLRLDEGAGGDLLRAAIDAVVPGDEAERARIAAGVEALFSGAPSSPEETFFAVRRLLAALAAVRPVVLLLDDLHWAEPLLLDLVEHLVQWSGDVPLLVVAAARPELRDLRSSLVTPGALVADVVTLGGLDAASAMRLAAGVVGASELPAALVGRVLATSEGNPLFLAELVRMLVQDGTLRRDGDRWVTTVEVAELDMPPTIQVLLAARIERLRAEERVVLERAAVVGRQFSRAAVEHLLGGDAAELDARLEALKRSELIEPDSGWFLGEPALRFHHVLIRDAAYRQLLKETRADLHEQVATWIQARAGDALEHDESLGWHLEQAHQNLRELGAIDERGRALGERAARHLGAAGRRALARDDLALAASLLGRAIDTLDAAHPARAELVPDWCEALLAAGEVGTAARAVDELARVAGGSARLGAWHACFAGQLAALTDPQSLRATAERVAAAAAVLAAHDDPAGEAKAHAVHASALARLGAIGACEAALDRALAAARRARDRRRANSVLAGAPVAALWGPSPVTRASGRCLDVVRVLRITQGAPAVEAVALRCQAVLEALRGRSEAARRMIASSRRMVEELGIAQQVLEADVFAGLIELLEDDPAAAERCLTKAYDGLRERGLGIDAARAAALLGRALLALGRADEAEARSHDSEALAGDDLKAAISWRGVRAGALARRGEHAEAVALAERAVAIAAQTDDLLDHADARLALASALRAAGRDAEAAAEERRAIELWEAKGATFLVERTRRDRAEPAHDTALRDAPPAAAHVRAGPVRRNAAIAEVARLDAAVAAGDHDAIDDVFADLVEIVHHPLGAIWDREGALASLRMVLRNAPATFFNEPLATLGEALVLTRQQVRSLGAAVGDLDVGVFEHASFWVSEVNASGRRVRAECFALDKLGHAIVRLYERFAALQDDGAARDAATRTARMVAVIFALGDAGDFTGLMTDDSAFVDHRVLGFAAGRGARGGLELTRTLREMTSDLAVQVDEILALSPGALFVRSVTSGEDRQSGGRFERALLQIRLFGADGRLTRTEWFDVGDAVAARARFAALTTAAAEPAHRPRPNLATAELARVDAAVAARDVDAVAELFGALIETVHHPLGVTWDHDGAVASFRLLFANNDFAYRHEPLATLGERLALSRQRIASSGVRRDAFDIGELAAEYVWLSEVDAAGRRVRSECFATARLAHAVARLYERHAELLDDARERDRAVRIADGVRAVLGLDEGAGPAGDAAVAASPDAGAAAGQVVALLAVEPDALATRRTRAAATGDGAPVAVIELCTFTPHGRVHREELAADDANGQAAGDIEPRALARLRELQRRAPLPPGPAPRALDNLAVRHVRELDALWAAGDGTALERMFAPEIEIVHHPTGATYGFEGAVVRFREMFDGPGTLAFRHEPLATLGDALALCRVRTSAAGMVYADIDAGAIELDYVIVLLADRAARALHVEVFASDRLNDAVVAFYAQHAATVGDPAARARATAVARAVAAVVPMDLEALRSVLEPDVAFADRRTIGFGAARGAERYLRGARTLIEMTQDATNRTEDVLVATDDALLLRRLTLGFDRTGGGAFELQLLMLWTFGAGGRVSHVEMFEADRDAAALARVAELSPSAPAAGRAGPHAETQPGTAARGGARAFVANAAQRAEARFRAAFEALDADAVERLIAPGFTAIDRRRSALFESDRATYLAAFRPMLESFSALRSKVTPLATRGERLALSHVHWYAEGRDGGGPSEFEWLTIIEVDDAGRAVFANELDVEDVAAAYEALDARYLEREGAAHPVVTSAMRAFADALARRDWVALAAACAPDLVVADHRRLGWEALRGADAYVDALRALVELAPDTRMRLDHVATNAGGFLVRAAWTGTRDGGAFEEPSFVVGEIGRDGRIRRLEQLDDDALDEARARFRGLAADSDPLARWLRPNAAVAARDRLEAAIAARDWAAMRAAFAPDGRLDDRRRLVRTTSDADVALAALRWSIESGTELRTARRLLAVFGERIAIEHMVWHGTQDGAPFEIELVALLEADEEQRIALACFFDVEDRRDAFREASVRWAALEPALAPLLATSLAFVDATRSRDPARMRALLADDVVMQSWRRTGAGLLEGADAYLGSLQAIWDLTSTTDVELVARLAIDGAREVVLSRIVGTLRDGGAFETLACTLVVVEDGRFTRFEQFELDDVERALARFAEPSAQRRTGDDGALVVPPNAASRTSERSRACARAGDAEGMRALCSPAVVFEDRRPLMRTVGDRSTFLADWRHIPRAVWQHSAHTLLATNGDRLCLHHHLFKGDPGSGEFEIETLTLTEIDDSGRIVALVIFDPEDHQAAAREMLERYMRGEGAATMPPAQVRFLRALATHDLAAARAALDDDFAFVDHRRTGIGQISDADAYVASLAAIHAESADFTTDVLYHVAVAEHGSMSVGRMFGTLREGGGAFESVFVRINRYEDGRNVGVELFEVDDLERARLRFAELGREHAARWSGVLRLPSNLATRADARWGTLIATADWDGLRRLLDPAMRLEDRRPLLRMSGDRETLVDACRLGGASGFAVASQVYLSVLGDRLSLSRNLFRAGPDGAPVETELLQLIETDAEGRIVAVVHFDPDDRRAASLEMIERLRAGEAAETMPLAVLDVLRAVYAHDLQAIRAALDEHFAFVDHRRTGLGRMTSADEYLTAIAAVFEMSDDVATDELALLEVAEHGALSVGRLFGTLRDGGPFESVYLRINRFEGERFVGTELFELDDRERARERFAELGRLYAMRGAGALRIAPSAASRMLEDWATCVVARDWDALRALLSPDLVWEDRRRTLAMAGDRETVLETVRLAVSARLVPVAQTVLASFGERLLLVHGVYRKQNGAAAEIELLQLYEVDPQGRLARMVWFDPADRRAACLEMAERFVAGEGGARFQRLLAVARANATHDVTSLDGAIADDFVYDDHRRTGPGRLQGRAAYVRWMAALYERSPDAQIEPRFFLAIAPHASLLVGRTVGTQHDGGSFESPFVGIATPGGIELFEVEDLDQARARFAELAHDAERAGVAG